VPRSGRVLFCGFAAGLVAWVANGLRVSETQAPLAPQAPVALETPKLEAAPQPARRHGATAGGTAEIDIARFVALLDRLRSDDEEVIPEMRELADRLCSVHDRCDGKDILEYYAALPGPSRTEGRSESAAVDEAWSRLRPKVTDANWDPSTDEDVAYLRELAARPTRDSDACPSAMAKSFLAYIDVGHPGEQAATSDASRSDWIERTAEEAQLAIEGFKRCGMRLRTLQPMWVLGSLDLESERDHEAEQKFRECLGLAERLGNDDWRERSLGSLIQVAKRAGDLGQTATLLDELASFRTPGSSWTLTAEKALLLLEQDFASTAVEFLTQNPPTESSDRRDWQLLLGSAQLRLGISRPRGWPSPRPKRRPGPSTFAWAWP
jgi:hypothetical protein